MLLPSGDHPALVAVADPLHLPRRNRHPPDAGTPAAQPGNAMPLSSIPVGTIVHNVEMKIGKGGAIARSAGAYAQIVGRDQGYVSLRLNSGEQRLIHGQCFASIGAV